MKTTLSLPLSEMIHLSTGGTYSDIENYYAVAGPDYEAWSPDFNMHFGYARKWTDIFSLEKMLVSMNETVIDRLGIDPHKNTLIADLGCGVGAVTAYTANRYPAATIKGITIVDYQIQKGNEMLVEKGLDNRAELLNENFERLSFEDEMFDHSYALESACHSSGSSKALFRRELARTLKTGGTFCIADGFLKQGNDRPWLFDKIYKKILACWALPCFGNLDEFVAGLRENGLQEIRVEEISMNIAPSVMHVPRVCIKFLLSELWKNKSLHLKKERWNNVYGPLLGMVLGLFRKHFGYYIISGKK